MRKMAVNNLVLLNELTDICNLSCGICEHGRKKIVHGDHPPGVMKEAVYMKIMDALSRSNVHLDCFHEGWMGEPLCHPKFIEFSKKVFAIDKTLNLFDNYTINTNGLLFDEKITDAFLDYARFFEKKEKGIFRVHFSIHAATEQVYERITGRPGNNLKAVIANIDRLLIKRKERHLAFPYLDFLFVVTQSNKDEARGFLDFWSRRLNNYGCKFDIVYDWPDNYSFKIADSIYFRREVAYELYSAEKLHKEVICDLGLIPKERINERVIRTNEFLRDDPDKGYEYGSIRRPCPALWRTLVVHNSGRVLPCCGDVNLELELGDLSTQSLDEIWNGPVITDMRLAHIRGDFKKYRRCYYCNNIDSFEVSDGEIIEYLENTGREQEIKFFLERMRNIRTVERVNQKGILNICFLSREYPKETGWGGIGEYTRRLGQGLAERGHNVHVICLSLDGDKEYLDGNVYIHRISHQDFFPFKGPLLEFSVRLEYSYKLYQKLRELINKYNIDIIEAPNFFAESFVYSLFKKVPLVLRIHTPFREIIDSYGWTQTFDRSLSCAIENAAVARSDLLISSAEICARKTSEKLGIDFRKFAVIPLGVELPKLNGMHNANLPDNLEVLFVGRLERRKGVHTLMRAIPYILEKVPQAHFTFIGRDTFVNLRYCSFEGAENESVKGSLLREFPDKYKNNLTFLGYLGKEELAYYYRSCDLLAAPSLYESFGLVYIEAMSYGKPVIGCGVGGVPEVVKDGETGILVPPEDHIRLAEAIIWLLNDPQERLRLGANARRHVEENFSREKMVERTLEAYKKVLKIR